MGQLIGISLALGLIAYVGTIGAVADLFFPEPEFVELDPRVAELVAAHRQLQNPLPCDATVAQRSAGKWEGPRCYMTKATREGL